MVTSASKAGASISFDIGGGKVAHTLDDVAFPCELSDRATGRTQTLLRGTVTGIYYATGGCSMDLTALTSPGRFPNGNYRVVFQMDNTSTYYAVYNHSTKKIKVYGSLGGELSDQTDISAIVFPFIAVGE
jgi:hypothetical protein